ncbi:MAG: hypothetical protein RIC29_12105 [Rhodospirillaceae bacterium]
MDQVVVKLKPSHGGKPVEEWDQFETLVAIILQCGSLKVNAKGKVVLVKAPPSWPDEIAAEICADLINKNITRWLSSLRENTFSIKFFAEHSGLKVSALKQLMKQKKVGHLAIGSNLRLPKSFLLTAVSEFDK